MRYIIIFFVTIILSLFIMFYNPYLGVYKDNITISLDDSIEGYEWKYEMDNDNLTLLKKDNKTWKFNINKNGISNLYFTYSNNEGIKYKIYYKFKIKNNKIYWLEGYGEGLLSYPNPY